MKKEAYTILLRAVGVGSSLRLGQQPPTSGWGTLRFITATAPTDKFGGASFIGYRFFISGRMNPGACILDAFGQGCDV